MANINASVWLFPVARLRQTLATEADIGPDQYITHMLLLHGVTLLLNRNIDLDELVYFCLRTKSNLNNVAVPRSRRVDRRADSGDALFTSNSLP